MGLGQAKSTPMQQEDNEEAILSKVTTSPEYNLKSGFIFADRGYGPTAFHLLLDGFMRCAELDEPAMQQLAGALFTGYRYLSPRVWQPGLRDVTDKLKDYKGHIPPMGRTLCLAQIGITLCESGDIEDARELFALPEVKNLVEDPRDILWDRAHLMRKFAQYYLQTSQTERAKELIRDADKLEGSPGNNPSVAMFGWLADMLNGQNVKSAWDNIENDYTILRPKLIVAAQNKADVLDEAFHLFALVQKGAVARYLAGDKYPKSEQDEDCLALKWWLPRLGRVKLVAPSLLKLFSGIPGALGEISAKCDSPQLDDGPRRPKQVLRELKQCFDMTYINTGRLEPRS